MSNFISYTKDVLILFVVMIIATFTVMGICSLFISSPVKDIDGVNVLIKQNDSIKVKINNLDSIKNAKIIEVKSLDNDSTIKLFYELVSD